MERNKILSSHILSLHVGDSSHKSTFINAIFIITAKSMHNIFHFDIMKEIHHSHPKNVSLPSRGCHQPKLYSCHFPGLES